MLAVAGLDSIWSSGNGAGRAGLAGSGSVAGDWAVATSLAIAADGGLGVVAAGTGQLQQADELGELGFAEVAKQLEGRLLNDRVHLREQLQAGV